MKKIPRKAYDLCGLKLLTELAEAERYFTKKEYIGIVKQAKELFECGKFAMCEKELDRLPSSAELLEQLVRKLRGKSVAKTLRQMQEGKVEENSWATLKGLMSLGTHLVIEREHGSPEYEILLPTILEKVSEIGYNLLSER